MGIKFLVFVILSNILFQNGGEERYGMVCTGPLSSLLGAYPKESDNCGQLEEETKMAVGARVRLRRIIGIEVWLVNGVMGIVLGFEWPEGVSVDHPEKQPTAYKVLLANKRVGQKARRVARKRDGIVG